MPTTTLVEQFAELFEGRKSHYGLDAGGSQPTAPMVWADSLWRRHLDGTRPIGVYPMVSDDNEWFVKWGCVDFDIKGEGHKKFDYENEAEAHEAALDLQLVLETWSIMSWLERTRSGGRHVWVFAEEWVPAAIMRRALLVACEVAGASQREVNPKAEVGDNPDYLGNYVRLPYAGKSRPIFGHRVDVPMSLAYFVTDAMQKRTNERTLSHIASLYYEPPRPKVASCERGRVELDDSITSRLNGLAYTILRDGPLENGDRSTTLARLAHLCAESGLSADEAMAVLDEADRAWGKFHNRRDGERQLERMIERAYEENT